MSRIISHLTIIALFFVLLSTVSAQSSEQSFGSVEQNLNITLSQICANCTSVNITSVIYPNKTQAVGLVEMTQDGSEWHYNYSNTEVTGTYIVKGIGDPDGTLTIFTFDFEVTPNGEIPTVAKAILYIGILAVLIFGLVMVVFFGVKGESLIIKTFGLGFGYFFLLAITFISWNMASDFLTSTPFLVSFLYYSFLVLMIGFFPFLLILFAYGVYMALTIKEINDMVKRGIPESEAAERVRWKK